MKAVLMYFGLLLLGMAMVECSKHDAEDKTNQPIRYELDFFDDLSLEAATTERVFVADIIWYYETEHEVSFGNFPPKTIVVPHIVEDAWARIVIDQPPTEADFTERLKPPYPGAKVIEIQAKRVWPKLEPDFTE
jgi:hypothetical protein